MKFFSYSTAVFSTLVVLIIPTVMTAPVFNNDSSSNVHLLVAEEIFIDSTTAATTSHIASETLTSNPPPAITLADAVPGTTATASISITDRDVTAQNSGADRTIHFVVVTVPLVLLSAFLLI